MRSPAPGGPDVVERPSSYRVPVRLGERRQVRFAELLPQRGEGRRLVRAEPADVHRVGDGGDERRRAGLGVELVRVHAQAFLTGLRQIVGAGEGKPRPAYVLPGVSLVLVAGVVVAVWF